MFAQSEPAEEGVKIEVGKRDVRPAERRNHFDTSGHQADTAEDDDIGKTLQSCLAENVDLLIVGSEKARHP